MHKNPFIPQPSYTHQQPPLPPGPPPPPAQPDYSSYWANAAAQGAAAPTFNPQWPPSTPAQAPPPEQSALYANYGYGTGPGSWQRQQQQQQHQQQAQQAQQAQQQLQHMAQLLHQSGLQGQPATQAGAYYQQSPGYPHQQYVPPATAQSMVQQFGGLQPPLPQGGPQQIFQQHHRPGMVQQTMQQPMQQRHHHQPQPPAKRQRFDGPPASRAGLQQASFPVPPVGTAQGAPGSSFIGPQQPGRGIPSGPHHMPRGAPIGNRPPVGGGTRLGRGMPTGGSRGNVAGRGGSMRGGSFGNMAAGRGGAPLRGHGSRGNFANRRGGGSFHASGSGFIPHQPSFRARGQGHPSNRGRYEGPSTFIPRDGSFSTSKKEENKRTLTDFKIVGLEIKELSWSWGVLPQDASLEPSDDTAQHSSIEAAKSLVNNSPVESSVADDPLDPAKESEASNTGDTATPSVEEPTPAHTAEAPTSFPQASAPPSRIRIYFHTPFTPDDANPSSQSDLSSLSIIPSDSRKGKRKKLEDDDDVEDGREPPPLPAATIDDRSSMAPSVAPSVSESLSEDWLMAAIVDDEETPTENGDADEEQLEPTQIIPDLSEELHLQEEVNDATGEPTSPLSVANFNLVSPMTAGSTTSSSTNLLEFQGQDDADMPEALDTKPTLGVQSEFEINPGNVVPIVEERVVVSDAVGPEDAAETTSQLEESPPESKECASASTSLPEVDGSTLASVSKISSTNSGSSFERISIHSHETSANHVVSIDTQASPSAQPRASKRSLEEMVSETTIPDLSVIDAPSGDSSLLSNGQAEGDHQRVDAEHFPEPPDSNSSASAVDEAKTEAKDTKTPSANRLSISYAADRRLLIDSQVVQSLKIFRQRALIEITIIVDDDAEVGLKGIEMEYISESTKAYVPVSSFSDQAEGDPTIPPFTKFPRPHTITVVGYFDTTKPLSEPRWVRTGDIPEWLRSMFGRPVTEGEGWEKKIIVSDPDPPPTIWTVLDSWATNSGIGQPADRQRFVKTHMAETDNILEVLLRLVRGERASLSSSSFSATAIPGPLLAALSPGFAYGLQQTHVSLAVMAMFRMAIEYAVKVDGEKGKDEVEARVGEVIRCIPSHLIYKSLDGIFKEWRMEKKHPKSSTNK